jgi:hypothetical protein
MQLGHEYPIQQTRVHAASVSMDWTWLAAASVLKQGTVSPLTLVSNAEALVPKIKITSTGRVIGLTLAETTARAASAAVFDPVIETAIRDKLRQLTIEQKVCIHACIVYAIMSLLQRLSITSGCTNPSPVRRQCNER